MGGAKNSITMSHGHGWHAYMHGMAALRLAHGMAGLRLWLWISRPRAAILRVSIELWRVCMSDTDRSHLTLVERLRDSKFELVSWDDRLEAAARIEELEAAVRAREARPEDDDWPVKGDLGA